MTSLSETSSPLPSDSRQVVDKDLRADDADPIPAYEPIPDFQNVTNLWKSLAWPCLVYGYGTAFSLLSLYTLYTTLALVLSQRYRQKNRSFILAINFQIILLGLSRALCFFVDPYNVSNIYPPLVYSIIFNIGFPCLTSAFGLVNWVILEVSKIRMMSTTRIRSVRFLVTVIMMHYVVVMGVAVITNLVEHVQLLVTLCEGFFVVWGFILSFGFFVGAYKLHKLEKTSHKVLYGTTCRSSTMSTEYAETSKVSSLSRPTTPGDGSMTPCRRSTKTSIVSSLPRTTASGDVKDNSSSIFVIATGSVTLDDCNEKETQLTLTTDNVASTAEPCQSRRSSQSSFQSKEHATESDNQNSDSNPNHKPRLLSLFPRRKSISDDAICGHPRQMKLQAMAKETTRRHCKRSAIGKVLKISAITASLGIAASGINLYSILIVHIQRTRMGNNRPGLWEWYVYQLLSRFIELVMGCTMAYFTTTPKLRPR
ncbi:uncharacterized protein [Amphiura filiformis]|uniref:uncharacterized protein n=1 Tax=Amphiura filiformis TaxID=82378 RepID=UPI003B20E144